MEILILLLFFCVVAVALWLTGFWSATISTVNILLAACFATSFFEMVANQMEYGTTPDAKTFTYLIDFVALWGVFAISALFIRALTESFSAVRLRFDVATEMVGRSMMSLAGAFIFICFAHFSLMVAPLPPSTPSANMLSPDQIWLGFTQSRSRGALAEYAEAPFLPPYKQLPKVTLHPDDAGLNARVFDSRGLMPAKYAARRSRFDAQEMPRVNR